MRVATYAEISGPERQRRGCAEIFVLGGLCMRSDDDGVRGAGEAKASGAAKSAGEDSGLANQDAGEDAGSCAKGS